MKRLNKTIFSFQIYPDEQYKFSSDARIGITFENFTLLPISYQIQESYRTYFLNLAPPPNNTPIIGGEYKFGTLPFPAIFSMNVTVDSGE